MPDENNTEQPRRARLSGDDDYFDYNRQRPGPYEYSRPRDYYGPSYARESGIRSTRRTTALTAAALIAAAAATTGYLVHTAPAATATSGTTVGHTTGNHGQSGSANPAAPQSHSPVVTSGGSGVAGGGGGGGGWGDN